MSVRLNRSAESFEARVRGPVKVGERQAANAKPLKTAIASQKYTKYDASIFYRSHQATSQVHRMASGKPLIHLEAGWAEDQERLSAEWMREKKGVIELFTYDSLDLYAILWRNGNELLRCHGYDLNQECLSGNVVRRC